jgi:hypothetical protein
MGTFTIDGIEYEESDDEDVRYRICPIEENNIIWIEGWWKDKHQLLITKKYQSGYVIVDLEPYFDDSYTKEKGIDVHNSGGWIQESEFENPTYSYKFSSDIPETTQDSIIKIYEDMSDEGLEDEGWDLQETQIWFKGELEIDKIED